MFLAQEIDQVLELKKNKLVGINTYYSLVSMLTRAFKKKDLKFKFETFSDIEKDSFSASGLYDMTTDTRYVILNFSNRSFDFCLQDFFWDDFKFYISQVIQHESIHQHQWQHRDRDEDPVKLDFRNIVGSKDEEREYLSDLDEIDAYAHDIAMEIKYHYPNKDPYSVLKVINRCRKIPSFSYYKKTFKNCDWSSIKNKLLLKTYKWIQYA